MIKKKNEKDKEEEAEDEFNNDIIFDKDGIPCIMLDAPLFPTYGPPIPSGSTRGMYFIDITRNFTDKQIMKDSLFMNDLLKEIKELFRNHNDNIDGGEG